MKNRLPFALFLMVIFWVSTGLAEQNAASQGAITYSCYDWQPMSYKNDKGAPDGLFIDLLSEIFVNRLNIPLSVKFTTWKRAQFEVETGLSDLLLTVPTQKRTGYATQSSEPFFLLYLSVYTYKNHPLLKQINQIKTPEDIIRLGLKSVANLGNDWHKNNMEKKGVKTYYARVEESAIGFLAMERADIMIDMMTPTNHLIRKMGLSSKLKLTKAKFGPIKMHLLMSNKSPFLHYMPEINKTFKALKEEGRIDEVISRYSSFKKAEEYKKEIFAGKLK